MYNCAPLHSHSRLQYQRINGPYPLLPPSRISMIQTTVNPNMLSHEQSSCPNFFTSTRGRGGSFKPDHGNRFYYRGSRGRRGGSATRLASNLPPEPDLKEGLDKTKIIDTIPAPEHHPVPEDFPIDNVKYVASYNWTKAEKPTIIVPGSPAIWTERDIPFQLEPDDATVYVDQNTAQLSQYPMLPLFAAADAIHGPEATPPVDWTSVDVVTDRNGLRKLLRWLNPSSGREVRDFRIDVQLVGTKTLVLNRWESPANETAMTSPAPDCPSSGHQRAITYDMFNMKMIVRCGVDACLPASPNTSAATKSIDDSDSDLADALSNVPQDSLVEVMSRSVFFLDQLDWNEIYPQLVLSQTSALRMGVHQRGEFIELREWQLDRPATEASEETSLQSGTQKGADVLDLSAQRQETAVQVVRLAKVLQSIQKLAIARGPGPEGSFSLVCEDGKLRVYARKKVEDGDGKSLIECCLPPEIVARFETRIDSDA
ncbi:hypothetical protein EI94DRAFT_1717948 [Lactarius quietus]|nr:hypothetical protein EI94DRAFT_1717948 [Lactarius quietus]